MGLRRGSLVLLEMMQRVCVIIRINGPSLGPICLRRGENAGHFQSFLGFGQKLFRYKEKKE